MSIFEKSSDSVNFEKDVLGVRYIRPYKHGKDWVFDDKDGIRRKMAPAPLTDGTLSPIIVGADRLIQAAALQKGIPDPQDGFVLYFGETPFPGAEIEMRWNSPAYNGDVYDLIAFADPCPFLVPPDQKAWLCPYMDLYFDEPPKVLYLRIEKDLIE